MTTTITKGVAGNQDLNLYDGVNDTFSRVDSKGNTLTLNLIGNTIDVLAVYGAGSNFNSTSINAALTAISTTKMTLVLHPGTWTMNDNITIPATVDLHCPKGVTIVTTGYTLTVNGIISGWPTFSGSGTVTINYTSVASAATINLAALASNFVHVTGSTGPVTSLGSVPYGKEFTLVFDSTPTLTHNATSLILPGGANMTMCAGDTMIFRSEGSSNWRCIGYLPALGIGTLAAQAASAVAVTGGTLAGITACGLTNNSKITALKAAGGAINLGYLNTSDYWSFGEGGASVFIGLNSTTNNPLNIWVGGASYNVTAGADNSATSGYRHLMIPNA